MLASYYTQYTPFIHVHTPYKHHIYTLYAHGDLTEATPVLPTRRILPEPLREADPAGAAARDVSDATREGARRGEQLVVLRLADSLRYPVHVAARVGGGAHGVQDVGGNLLSVPGVREEALGVALLDEEGDEAPVDEEGCGGEKGRCQV